MVTKGKLMVAALMVTACSATATGAGGGDGGTSGSGGSAQGGSAQGGSAQGGSGATGTGGGLGAFGGDGGTGGGLEDGGGCTAVEETAQNTVSPVDIIWAVDNSGSMGLEAAQVQNSMNAFASYILNQGIDVHVIIISYEGPPSIIPFGGTYGVCIPPPLGSGSCPNDSRPPVYFRVDDEVSSTNGLEKFIQHYPTYKPYLRQNSLKNFAVITDDDANLGAAAFVTAVDALDPGWFDRWMFHGVWCSGACANNFIVCANEGTVYDDLMSTPHAGTRGDMCAAQSGFAPVFTALAQTIAAGTELSCDWAIPSPPTGEQLDPSKVNVSYTPDPANNPTGAEDFFQAPTQGDCGTHNNAWYYDNPAAPTRVIACPDTCVRIKNNFSGRVNVAFGCATETVPT